MKERIEATHLFVVGIQVWIEEIADASRRIGGESAEGAVHHLSPAVRPVAHRHVVGDAHRHVQEEGGDHAQAADCHLEKLRMQTVQL